MGKGKVRVFLLRRRAVAALGALVLAGAIFYDDHVISAIRSIGMEPIQWDVEALAASGTARGASDTRAFCRLSGPEGRFKIQLLQIRRRIHIFLNRVLVVPHLLPENISRFKRDGYFFNKFIVI